MDGAAETAGGWPADVLARARDVRLLVLDVDGVLTDGHLTYGPDGGEAKAFHVRDGFGMRQLMKAGIGIAIISGRDSRATAARMAELGVRHVVLGCDDKAAALARLLGELGLGTGATACVGDDVPDLPLLAAARLAVAVADAHPRARDAAHWITGLPGGRGAVREVCDLLLAARGPT
jgi:3-deoxy-D-manno-octulosonate 8-phosphate phosphatase (KDO 8-P phosphatase)